VDFFLIYTILVCAGAPISLGLVLFAEYRKLDELESYFSENSLVRGRKRFWGRRQRIGRFMRMGLMIDFLSMPKRCVKQGYVTESELAAIPKSLRRWALWPYRFGMSWAVASVIWSIWYHW
jgi:hypothetical protein